MASTLSFRAAVTFVVIGMCWGLFMAASGDHSTVAGHAHLNLLGWVSLFLFGVFYHLHPTLNGSKLARTQVGIWIVAVAILAVGVGMIPSGSEIAEPMAKAGSVLALADMIFFGYLVFRADARSLPRAAVPPSRRRFSDYGFASEPPSPRARRLCPLFAARLHPEPTCPRDIETRVAEWERRPWRMRARSMLDPAHKAKARAWAR